MVNRLGDHVLDATVVGEPPETDWHWTADCALPCVQQTTLPSLSKWPIGPVTRSVTGPPDVETALIRSGGDPCVKSSSDPATTRFCTDVRPATTVGSAAPVSVVGGAPSVITVVGGVDNGRIDFFRGCESFTTDENLAAVSSCFDARRC